MKKTNTYNHIKPISICLVYLFIAVATSCNQTNKPKGELNQLIDKISHSNNFSGAILIAFHDSIFIDKAYGFADNDKKIPNTPNTIFPIASITKLFIKQAILSLAEQGKINLNDTLSNYFDSIMFADQIRISDLLHHQSGLPDIHNRIGEYMNPWALNHSIHPDDLLDSINSFRQLDFPSGSQTAYSNSNYLLLARIIEQVSNQCLDNHLNDNIFIPFDLRHTGLYQKHQKRSGHAEGSFTMNDETVITPDFNFRNFWGTSNAYSTTHDLYKYFKSSQKHLPRYIADQIIQHQGYYPGYSSYFKVIPEIKLAIIILSNHNYFQPDLIATPVLSYFENKIKNENMIINHSKFEGRYKTTYLGNELIEEVTRQSGHYRHNNINLIPIKTNTFFIPNSGFTKLTFKATENNNYKMIANNNGLILTFEKIDLTSDCTR